MAEMSDAQQRETYLAVVSQTGPFSGVVYVDVLTDRWQQLNRISAAVSLDKRLIRRIAMNALLPHEGYIPVADGRVWYQIIGTGPGIPLLALHGGPGLGSAGLQPLAALAEDRPVVLYDQLGGGRSDRPDNPALWNITRFVAELATVRAALGLAQVHIFGHSYGTILAAEYALFQPSGLQSLILSGPVMSVPRYFSDVNRQKQELPIKMQEAIEWNEAAGTFDAPEYQNASLGVDAPAFCRNEAILATMLEEFGDPVTGINPQVYNTMWGPSEFWITVT
ncbi:MAG: proline iminopeptidase-family hydrolase [Anaerolineales bacterium]|nr:proline iminopeptidase-family hydrolase [Anaerolineales bacterium]